MELGLSGRKALVTGASKGIGYAIALELAREGCHVVMVARDGANLSSARDRIESEVGVAPVVFECDLARSGAAVRLASTFPDIGILINCAGAIPAGTLGDIDEARWREAWDLKVFGYINNTREFYRLMKDRGSGVIINIIGAGGERLLGSYIAGATGNAALMAFTRALGGSSPADGIRVVGINPGAVDTDRLEMMSRHRAERQLGSADRWRELLRDLPFGRAGKTSEIAVMTAFLASDLSGFTSGTIVTIDGGRLYRG